MEISLSRPKIDTGSLVNLRIKERKGSCVQWVERTGCGAVELTTCRKSVSMTVTDGINYAEFKRCRVTSYQVKEVVDY